MFIGEHLDRLEEGAKVRRAATSACWPCDVCGPRIRMRANHGLDDDACDLCPPPAPRQAIDMDLCVSRERLQQLIYNTLDANGMSQVGAGLGMLPGSGHAGVGPCTQRPRVRPCAASQTPNSAPVPPCNACCRPRVCTFASWSAAG
jgi:hypothetical protein